MRIMIGADPELFVFQNNQPVSAAPWVPGTKEEPYKVQDGAVQLDGFAAEFNIEPVMTEDDFVNNINSVLWQLRRMLPDDAQLKAEPVVHFTQEYVDAQPDFVRQLGCSADWNAYTGQTNPLPDGNVSFRTGAGHIHIGWTEDQDINDPVHMDSCRMLVKRLDASLGLASVVYDREGKHRRELYGKAGCFRPKPYGVEYRVLSNFWIDQFKLQRYVYRTTMDTVNDLIEGGDKWKLPERVVELAINKSDLEYAWKVLDERGATL